MDDGVREGWALEEPVDEQAEQDGARLATRVSRVFAVIFDGIFGGGVVTVATVAGSQVSSVAGVVALFLSALLMAGGQTALVVRTGQTLGKQFMGVRVERTNGDPAGFLHGVFLRYTVPAMTFGAIAQTFGSGADTLAALIDVLFIFGATRRCVHDLIADTRVVEV